MRASSTAVIALLCASFAAPAWAEGPPLAVTNPQVTLCVVPLEPYDTKMLDAVVRGITYVYGFKVSVLPGRKLPQVAWYAPRKRWRAEKLLEWMHSDIAPNHANCRYFVGFTKSDISTSKPPHRDWGVLGLGELGGKMAVVSSFRTHKQLKKPHTALRRTVKTVNHEIGHLMGLPHVEGAECLMQDAEGSVLTTDMEHGLLCQPTIEFIERERGYKIPRHEAFDWSRVE